MTRTMKIESDVAIRLAALKKKYRRPSYSDLLDSVCEFFEVTNLSLTDINTSKKPASVLVQEGTSKIVSFIKQNEKLYDKKVLDLVEKIYLVIKDQQPESVIKTSTEAPVKEAPLASNIAQEDTSIIDKLRKENTSLSSVNSQLEYKLQHQRKFIEEFLSKFEINRMRKVATISENELEYYQNELRKLWL